jgi:hypothetical protein
VSGHPLDSEGSEVQKKWLRAYFDIPYTLRPILKERMVNLRMSPEDADYIANFFKTVMLNNTVPNLNEESFTEEQVTKGGELFKEKGCRSCHILGEGGGYVGPPLTEVGDRATPGWIYAYTKDPYHYQPWAIQPDYGFSEEDAMAMSAYLMTWKKKEKKKPEVTQEAELPVETELPAETGLPVEMELPAETEQPVETEKIEPAEGLEKVSGLGTSLQQGS